VFAPAEAASVFRAAGALCKSALYFRCENTKMFCQSVEQFALIRIGGEFADQCAILSGDEKLFHLGLHVLHTASPCATV